MILSPLHVHFIFRIVVNLHELRPNNRYVNSAKLERVRQAWRDGKENDLPPILVAEIDGSLSLIDGHARAYAAFENGKSIIEAVINDLEETGGPVHLYRYIHESGPAIGIMTIADLTGRIVGPSQHRRLWIDYCTALLEENFRPF